MILGQFNGKNIVAPPNYGLRDLMITANDTVSAAVSPWSKQATVYNWQAQWWAAQINLPTMKRSVIAPWIAYLLELEGMGASTLLGNILEAKPLGSFTTKNLVPDSSFGFSWREWGGAPPNANWTVTPYNNGTPGYFTVASGDTASVRSQAFNLIPGAMYTLSCYADLTGITTAGAGGAPAVEIQWPGSFVPVGPPPGQAGRVSVTFTVPMNITQATVWISLQGSTGSGSATFSQVQVEAGAAMTAYVDGLGLYLANAGESGNSIAVAGFPPSTNGVLLPGDNLQIGYRLYKVLEPVNTDSSGAATIAIYPQLRDSPAQFTVVQWQMCCGLFRLTKNDRSWSASAVAQWGIHALDFVEDL